MQGRKSNAILDAGAHRGVLPEPPRRGGSRGRHRRRRRASRSRCPTRSSARSCRSSCRRSGRTRPASRSCPSTTSTARRDAVEKVLLDEGFSVLGWRDVPVDDDVPGKSAREVMPAFRAGLRRRRPSSPATSSSATCTSRAKRIEHEVPVMLARGGVYFPSLSARVVCLQGHAHARSAAATSTPTSATRASRPRSRSCTRGSRRTPSRAGRSRTRTGCSRTTARSTPCRATRTGCAPAKA